MKIIKEKYAALWKMMTELIPLRSMKTIGSHNVAFKVAFEDLKKDIEPLEKPKKIILFHLLKPIYEEFFNSCGFDKQLIEEREKDKTPDSLSNFKIKMRSQYYAHHGLRNILKQLEYDILCEKGKCNCELKQKLHWRLPNKSDLDLKFLIISDIYYKAELHKCPECGTYWEYYPGFEDETGRGWKAVKQNDVDQLKNYPI